MKKNQIDEQNERAFYWLASPEIPMKTIVELIDMAKAEGYKYLDFVNKDSEIFMSVRLKR